VSCRYRLNTGQRVVRLAEADPATTTFDSRMVTMNDYCCSLPADDTSSLGLTGFHEVLNPVLRSAVLSGFSFPPAEAPIHDQRADVVALRRARLLSYMLIAKLPA
jgi:hypothetical protein